MAARTVEVLLTVSATLADGYDEHDVTTLVRLHCDLTDLTQDDFDVSAVEVTDVREVS